MGTDTSRDSTLANLAIVWAIAGLAGVLICILLLFFTDISITGAVFLAAIVAGVAGLILAKTMTAPLAPPMASAPKAAPKAPPAKGAAAHAPKAAPAPAAAPAPVGGGKPAALSAPRGGAADDLKKIKGVGPKLEAMLNGMGIYHFDQIAAWTKAEIAWVDENLEGFKGRATRDEWVAQARDLAKG